MARVLSLDTTSDFGSLALLEDGRLIEECPLDEPDGYSPVLFSAITSLLDRHHWTIESIDLFAAGAGPGSFTGVRVGLSAVKGLAEATGKPAFGISNLQALASLVPGEQREVFLDARRGEHYTGVFDASLRPLRSESLTPAQHALPSPPRLAAAIGQIALRRWKSGERPDPASLDANYVRRSDAEMAWRDA